MQFRFILWYTFLQKKHPPPFHFLPTGLHIIVESEFAGHQWSVLVCAHCEVTFQCLTLVCHRQLDTL